jgi:TonB family protein
LNKPIQPVSRFTKSSASIKATSQNSTVQARSVTEVKYESSQNPTSLASVQLNSEHSFPLKTASIQKPLPVTLGEMPSNSQPVAGIKNVAIAGIPSSSTPFMIMKPQTLNKPGTVVRVGKEIFKPLARTGQAVGIRAQAPQSLDSELVAHYQPVIPIAATHFTSPLSGNSLLKEATIPPGFSNENLNQDEEVTTGPPEKIARLSDGASDLPAELLNQIKNGFSTKVRNLIAQVKYYPRIARNRGFEGQPVVAFTLGNGGELLELSIVNPSPFKLLNEAALDAVKSASPYPPIPELLKMKSIKFKVPIPFTLEER